MMTVAESSLDKNSTNCGLNLFDTHVEILVPNKNHVSYSGETTLWNDNRSERFCSRIEDVKSNFGAIDHPAVNIHLAIGSVTDSKSKIGNEQQIQLRLGTDWYESTKLTHQYLLLRVVSRSRFLLDEHECWGARDKPIMFKRFVLSCYVSGKLYDTKGES
jgi:hypothetical protein